MFSKPSLPLLLGKERPHHCDSERQSHTTATWKSKSTPLLTEKQSLSPIALKIKAALVPLGKAKPPRVLLKLIVSHHCAAILCVHPIAQTRPKRSSDQNFCRSSQWIVLCHGTTILHVLPAAQTQPKRSSGAISTADLTSPTAQTRPKISSSPAAWMRSKR